MTSEEQAQAVYTILKATYGQSPWSYEQVLADMKQVHTDYYFCYQGDEIIGFMSVERLFGESELTNIAIQPAYQGCGYGKQLLAQLDVDDGPIFLEVRVSNRSAITLYEGFGFKVVGHRKDYYHAPIEDALLMKKEES